MQGGGGRDCGWRVVVWRCLVEWMKRNNGNLSFRSNPRFTIKKRFGLKLLNLLVVF